jgi:methionine synthase II (cobalamin-independent)
VSVALALSRMKNRYEGTMMRFNCAATSIGSFPQSDAVRASELVLKHFPELPCWPQLPKRSFFEGMYVQYTENVPYAVIDEAGKRIYFSLEGDHDEEVQLFYQRFVEEDVQSFPITERNAAGLYAVRNLKDRINQCRPLYLKGQVTGPISFGLTVTDEKRRPIFYDESLREILVMALKMKALWQIDFLKAVYPDVMLFIDEPYLASVGSAMISLKEQDVLEVLGDLVRTIKSRGAASGIHCCGNTDWSLLMDTGVDMVSFDAFNYGDSFFLYPEKLRAFLDRQGVLAWGIVPTDPACGERGSVNSLLSIMETFMSDLQKKGFSSEEVLTRSVVTPTCGLASLTEEEAVLAMEKTSALSMRLRERYAFTAAAS